MPSPFKPNFVLGVLGVRRIAQWSWTLFRLPLPPLRPIPQLLVVGDRLRVGFVVGRCPCCGPGGCEGLAGGAHGDVLAGFGDRDIDAEDGGAMRRMASLLVPLPMRRTRLVSCWVAFLTAFMASHMGQRIPSTVARAMSSREVSVVNPR